MGQTRPDNYAIMEEQARQLFLTYDQSVLETNPTVKFDESHFYLQVLDLTCRISRSTGHVTWHREEGWVPSPRRHDTMVVYDYLCDASPNRHLSGEKTSIAGLGNLVHSSLSENATSLETLIDRHPDAFVRACQTLGGVAFPHCDIGFTFMLFPDLPITLQFWHSDEDFPPRLRYLWDTNTTQFIRYETTYYSLGLICSRIAELMG